MTSYTDRGPKPDAGSYGGFDHMIFWVGNAKQAANYYCTKFGFHSLGYKSLDTGVRDVVSHAVEQNGIIFVFQSALNPGCKYMGDHLTLHGDAVKGALYTSLNYNMKDVALTVDDCRLIWSKAVRKGAKSIRAPWEETDENGTVIMATVATYGNVEHTFVQRNGYIGPFLPGYQPTPADPILDLLPNVDLQFIDHCVGNQPENEMLVAFKIKVTDRMPACDFYEKCLEFHRFWSVDDTQMHTEYSALRSIVMTDYDEKVKMPINEPAPEFVDYHGGPGVQHIALRSFDIIASVSALKARGVQFLSVPKIYYDNLKQQLAHSPINVVESMEQLEQLNILVDYDEQGYLLQIFTKPVEDRPTLFIEIIQRRNHQGFGAGNFKALFEAIEFEQEKRGNL